MKKIFFLLLLVPVMSLNSFAQNKKIYWKLGTSKGDSIMKLCYSALYKDSAMEIKRRNRMKTIAKELNPIMLLLRADCKTTESKMHYDSLVFIEVKVEANGNYGVAYVSGPGYLSGNITFEGEKELTKYFAVSRRFYECVSSFEVNVIFFEDNMYSKRSFEKKFEFSTAKPSLFTLEN